MNQHLVNNMNKLLIPIIILTVLCISPNKSKADLIGNFNGGANKVNTSRQTCATTTAPSSGTVDSISYIASSSPANIIGIALYNDNGSTISPRPGTLVASNAPSGVTPSATKAWATTTLSASITGGNIYWMCTWANSTYSMFYDTATGFNYVTGDLSTLWESWASPFVSNSFSTARKMSIYMSYTPSGGGTSVSFSHFIVKGSSQVLKIISNLIIK